jgi:hypothetical protein
MHNIITAEQFRNSDAYRKMSTQDRVIHLASRIRIRCIMEMQKADTVEYMRLMKLARRMSAILSRKLNRSICVSL